ncbi:MAG: hypothetical protein ACR2QF_03745 [Geminicoccaceae bacterium]
MSASSTPVTATPSKVMPSNAEASVGKSKVEIRNISKAYGEDWAVEQVIEDLSFTVPPGELTVIVGPSGCGNQPLSISSPASSGLTRGRSSWMRSRSRVQTRIAWWCSRKLL